MAVVLFHAAVPGLGGGFVGVDVFFVISGFLITGLLSREMGSTGTVRLREFYGARARRLLPASATVAIVTAIASALLLPTLLIKSVLADGIASSLYVSNMWFFLRVSDYFLSETTPSPFLHYWSLGVEEQFYLLWPAVIIGTAWLVRRVRLRSGRGAATSTVPYLCVLLAVGTLSLVASVIVTRIWAIAAFYLLPTRAWELALGGVVALTVTQWHRLPQPAAAFAVWGGLAAIVYACTRFSAATPFPGIAALIPALGTALVIGGGCAASGRGIGRALSSPPMRAVGRLSYSWYLWHWPVLVFAPLVVGHRLELPARLAAVVISLGLAALTLRFIENPLRLSPSIRRSASRSLALGGGVTAVAVLACVVLMVLAPTPVGRGPAAPALSITAPPTPTGRDAASYDAAVRETFAQVEAAVAASVGLQAIPSNLVPALADAEAEKWALLLDGCMRNVLETGQPECASADTTSTTTVSLVGDSNAAMWNPALLHIAEQRHWRLESLAKQGCPLLDVPLTVLHRDYTECQEWREHIIDRLQTEGPQLVVLAISRRYGSSFTPEWNDALTRTVQELRATGAKVLVLGPIPEPGSVVPVCLSSHLDDASACAPERVSAVNDDGIADEIVATEAGGGQYGDVTGLFCTSDRCPVIVGNTLLYLDEYHLTVEYARLLAPVINTLTDRTMREG